MTDHKDLQNPDDFNDRDYIKWEYLLFDTETSKETLEDIVMTLAHLPTEKAQTLLSKFKASERAHEVEWLEVAMDEGKMWLMSPVGEKEERDLKALKLFFKKQDRIVEMMCKCDSFEYNIELFNIELTAINQLQKDKLNEEEQDDLKYRKSALNDLILMEQEKLYETKKEIAIDEKICKTIKESITTERYKDAHPWDIEGFHFDGETE